MRNFVLPQCVLWLLVFPSACRIEYGTERTAYRLRLEKGRGAERDTESEDRQRRNDEGDMVIFSC